MSEIQYLVEYAKSGRAKCKNKKCPNAGTPLEKGTVRLGKKSPNSFFSEGGMSMDWFHVDCMFDVMSRQRKDTPRVEASDDLIGWGNLEKDDQAKLLTKIRDFMKAQNAKASGKKPPPKIDPKKDFFKPRIQQNKTDNKRNNENEEKIEYKYLIILENNETDVRIQLREGIEEELGRGEKLNIDDKKTSRKQCTVVQEGPKMMLTRLGMNPTGYWSKGTKNPQWLEKGDSFQLSDGDTFSLSGDNHRFTVRVKKKKIQFLNFEDYDLTKDKEKIEIKKNDNNKNQKKQEPKKKQNNEIKKKPEQQPQQNKKKPEKKPEKKIEIKKIKPKKESKKRKLEEISDSGSDSDVGWGDVISKPSKKKQKVQDSGSESDSDYDMQEASGNSEDEFVPKTRGQKLKWLPENLPKCQYGESCYRKNPLHFQSESHPENHQYFDK